MRISELITALENWKEKVGDEPVVIDPATGGEVIQLEDDGDDWGGGYITLHGNYPVKQHMLNN